MTTLTKLQLFALEQAKQITESAQGNLQNLARTHDFASPLCILGTPENELMQKLRTLETIIFAILEDK